MADYKFDKPWAAESQNVQDFTKEEWGTGIVEKSLVSSKQFNGVMQAVTSRFLDLEAVEDRQFVYDFVVDDDVSEQNFILGNTGNAKSVLVKKNINADEITINPAVLLLSIQTSNIIDANKITSNNTNILTITGGGRLFSDSKNWEITGRVQLTEITVGGANITGGDVVVSNCYLYCGRGVVDSVNINNSRLGSLGGVNITNSRFSESILSIQTGANSTFVDCSISSATQFNNCRLIRCTIPNNTKLTNCTLIDCDYTVDTYKANLVTGTTFQNCNVTIAAPQTTVGEITTSDCVFRNCKLTINSGAYQHVQGSAYDCEFVYDDSYSILNNLYIYGNSFTKCSDNSAIIPYDFIPIYSKFAKSIFDTVSPFFKFSNGKNVTIEGAGILFPGVINVIYNDGDKTTQGGNVIQSYFISYRSTISNRQIKYGNYTFVPVSKFTHSDGWVKITI